jgi:hypothetical protein
MPNYSARDMLLRMANGGSVGVATSALNNIVPTYGKNNATAADLLAAEQRILGEIAASPDTWDVATAYNAILESGVTVEDALNAGVKQSTIDAIFTSGAPLPDTAFSTPSTIASAYESAPFVGKDMQPFYTQAQNYVAGLMADGVIDENERREAQTLATEGGYTFQDILAAGVDPSILFDVLPTKKKEEEITKIVDVFPQTQTEYVPPTVYQPIDFDPGIYAPGEEALDREFRDSPPRTEVLDQYGNLAGFDYTPAAKLLSATGSGFSFTPPSVTSRPRSLMDTGTLNRYTQGRAAQDLRQLVGNQTIDGVTPEQRYQSYAGLLGNTGSYGGGLSRSQLFALKRQQDSQQARAKQEENTGTIAEYLAKYEDVRTDYARAKAAGEIPANTTPEAFALNHYNTYGRFDRPFILIGDTGSGRSYTSPAIAGFGEGDEESRQSNFTTRGYDTELLARDLGTAGGARIVPVFAEGGPVKKPRGFEDGGPADSMTADELTAQLMAMDTQEAPVTAQEPRPTDQVQTESRSILDNLNRAMSQVTQPVTAAVTDMTVGLGDLAQMGTKAVANKMGIETKPFVPVGENIKASVGADNVSPLNPIYMGTQILPAAKLQKALAAGPAAYREAMAYLAGEGGAQVAATQFPDSLAAQLAGAVTGDMSARGILDSLDGRNVRRMAGDEPPIDDGPLLEGEPEGTVLGISDQSESGKMLDDVDAAAPTGTATVTVPPVEIIPDAKGHALPPILLTAGTGEKAVMPVVQSFTPQNKDVVLGEIDAVVRTNPNALASANNWLTAEAQAFGGDYLPAPPSQAIDYNQTPSALAAKLDKLTPQLKATVDEGFRYVNEIKNLYNSRIATPDLTGRMFLWGILSRGAGPAQQEAAFLDLVSKAEPYIAKSVNGEFTDADLVSWKQMVSESLPEGSPAKSVTMNANAAGTLLKALSEKSPSGQSVLKVLHNDLADPRVSGPQFRRKFFELTNKPGIDNKVVSFIGLVSGKDDLLVMDRIQSRHLWDDGRYKGKNIYDGIGSNKGGLSKILGGPRGLMITEMLENGLRDSAKKAYEMIGRPQDGSLGRMHWETWLIEGNQGVSHSTLQSVRSGSPIGFGVTEGKPGTFSSGMTYRQAINGPVVEYPLSDGNVVRMTPERQKEFESFIKKPKNGIVPKGFKVKQAVTWYERPEVNRRKLDDAARQFENANPDGSLRSGDVRPYAGGDTLSERRRKFLRSFRADQGRRAAATGVVQGLDNGRRAQEASGPYQRETVKGYGGDGLLSFSPDSSALTQYQSAGLNLPVIRQVEAAANAPAYNVEMTNAMKGHN